jgi:hypothetical protein
MFDTWNYELLYTYVLMMLMTTPKWTVRIKCFCFTDSMKNMTNPICVFINLEVTDAGHRKILCRPNVVCYDTIMISQLSRKQAAAIDSDLIHSWSTQKGA